MSFISFLAPKAAGFLPKWQLVVSGLAFLNSLQNLLTLSLTRRVYSNRPAEVTALQSRTFAVWSFTAAMIRFYCAYHVNEKAVYDITMWSYVAALIHFTSEWLVYRTANLGAGLLSPMIVSPVSLVWMMRQYDFYVTK